MIKIVLFCVLFFSAGWLANEQWNQVQTKKLAENVCTVLDPQLLADSQSPQEATTQCPDPSLTTEAAPAAVESPAPTVQQQPTTHLTVSPPTLERQLAALYSDQAWDDILTLYLAHETELADASIGHMIAGHALLRRRKFDAGLIALRKAYEQNATAETSDAITAIVDAELTILEPMSDPKFHLQFLRQLTTYQSDRPEYWYDLAEVLTEQEEFTAAEDALITIASNADFESRVEKLSAHIKRMRAVSTQRGAIVPLLPYGEHYLVSAKINQKITVTLLLDTGASVTTLSPTIISTLGVPTNNSPALIINTANGQVRARQYVVPSITIGESYLPNVPAGILDLGSKEFDGLLGMSYLNHFDFYIDQQRNKLHLSPR